MTQHDRGGTVFVGISLVFRGSNWIGLGVALRGRNERLGGLAG
jgi:hypothetical protein